VAAGLSGIILGPNSGPLAMEGPPDEGPPAEGPGADAVGITVGPIEGGVGAGGTDDPLRTHRQEVTVCFLDLRGFTAFAETVEPEEVMGVLREINSIQPFGGLTPEQKVYLTAARRNII